MKKTLLIMVMAFALLLTQCRKPEVKFPTPSASEGVTVSMTVTAGPGSKTDITAAGAITWSSGDKLYVGFNGKYVGCLEIKSGQNTPTGWFSGNVTLPNGTTGDQTFHFFYLGSNPPAVTSGASSVEVSFATQEIYADDGKLKNASKHHVGYGSAKGTVAGSEVTGINVTLVSKVALARFSFKKNSTDYIDELTLSGTNIYKEMTVNFAGTFTGKTNGNITLTAGHGERYVMLVPTGDATAQTLTFTGSSESGTGDVPGLESNKFYGKTDAIPVTLTASAPTHETVNMGLPSPYDKLEWATCNLGASKPEEYGDYYAWGEILPYYADGYSQESPCTHWRESMTTGAGNTVITNGYAWKTYSQGGSSSFAEWTTKPYDATSKVLTSEHDAATQAWGEGWRMPTTEEWKALYDNTTNAWTGDYNGTGVAGRVFTSKKDTSKTLFLPAAGLRDGTSLNFAGSRGRYWSSSLGTDRPDAAYGMYFVSGDVNPQLSGYRYLGFTVRPVR